MCRVSCRDSRGVEHTIEVTAQSLYEAIAQALSVFRENNWHEEPDRDPRAVVVNIKQPEISTHSAAQVDRSHKPAVGAPLKALPLGYHRVRSSLVL